MNIVLTKGYDPRDRMGQQYIGLDHQWYLCCPLSTIGLPNIGLAIISVYSGDLPVDDTSADQTAEVLQAEQRNAAGDSEDSEESIRERKIRTP